MSSLTPAPPPPNGTSARDERWVALLTALASSLAFFIYGRRGDILLYGDAVAHIGIARRLVDSLTPGLSQLGTVWLPLPHLLMAPLVAATRVWQSGATASLPTMLAYVAGAVGVFRLARGACTLLGYSHAHAAGWLAAFIFAANPSLLYLQTTAMTEPLYLAFFIWATVQLVEFAERTHNADWAGARRSLLACGVLLFCACWTRYDGWFALPFFVLAALLLALKSKAFARLRRAFVVFVLISAAAPALWLGWNAFNYGNPVEFATGPYSARAIEQRSAGRGEPLHPGSGAPLAATQVFAHAVQLTLGEKRWGVTLFWMAAIALALCVTQRSKSRSLLLLLLWLPLPFYALSIAYGSVPIFLPLWSPYSYYNARYGLELLPALAVFLAISAAMVARLMPAARAQRLAFALAFTFIAAAYLSCYVQNPNRPRDPLPGEPFHGPAVWREAVTNARTRIAFESELARVLLTLPPSARLLMYTGDHIGALQRAGIPLRRVVNETNDYYWRLALAAPAQAADCVVAIAGDPVSQAVAQHPESLTLIATIEVEGQPPAFVYRRTPGAK